MNDNTLIVLLVVGIIALIILGPLLVIWALNALFPVLAIPYSLKTWFATLIVCSAIRGSASYKKNR